jgi:hypothetical protein
MTQASPMQEHRSPRRLAVRAAVGVLAAVALLSAPTSAVAANYTFTKVADSVADGLDPSSFGSASINAPGDVAFRAGRVAPDGFNTIGGIYRANAGGGLTTIVEDAKRFGFIGRNPSMNDLGQVSFAARLNEVDRATGDTIEAILRGDGKQLTEIATTAEQFNFFGFDTSLNNTGVVAFKAELDPEFNFDEGLFSGSGDKKLGTTTHYLASTSPFVGEDSRPSINNVGNIAFREQADGDFDDGIFVTSEGGGFTTIAHDPDHSVREPVLNDAGTVAFTTSFFKAGQFVTAIVTGSGRRPRTVVDTQGDFASFGFRPAPLNNNGDVAFLATLDDFQTTGIFVGPDPVADRVIATGDTLDGAIVTGLGFAEEGLNDSGQLAFTASFQDPNTFETRVAVFRATPVP